MPSLFDLILFAQNAPAKAAPNETSGGIWQLVFMLWPVPLLWYFMIIMPQRRQDQKRKDMINALKKNDRVLTSAGIYGTVVSVDEEGGRVVVRVSDDPGVKMTFSKDSIVRVVETTADKEKEKVGTA